MEGLRVSKLEEGQQWGKNTSSKDKTQWGRRPPFIGGEKIQPLSPHSARTTRYYRTELRYYRGWLRYYRCRLRYYRMCSTGQMKACCTGQRAVEPPERYYRAPLRYYRKAGNTRRRESTDVKNYFRTYFR